MPKCKICGARIEDGVAVCPSCGAKVVSSSAEAAGTNAGTGTSVDLAKPRVSSTTQVIKTTCPSCGAEVIGEHRFCPQCGVNLKEAAEEKKAASQQQERRCPSCGSVIQQNARFCPDCGASLAGNTGKQPAGGSNIDTASLVAQADKAYRDDDYQTALKYYRIAAERGNVDAMYRLGGIYRCGYIFRSGEVVGKNGQEADKWFHQVVSHYRRAAEQGDADAMHKLGKIYEYGEVVVQDNQEAVKWYKLAAEHGNTDAMYKLRNIHVD